MDTLKQKRQYYHQLLIALGEERYKEVIVSARFGVESTTGLSEESLDILIGEARMRLNTKQRPITGTETNVRRWRNKCLLVLNERGILATPKDWAAVNAELAKKQYQWIMTNDQVKRGLVNHKGLYAFTRIEDLKKLFRQLTAIRDNEQSKAAQLKQLMINN